MSMFPNDSGKHASEDGNHVYARWLTANENGKGICTVIGLHPEGVNQDKDAVDDTAAICLEFAKKNNYRTLLLVNLYSQIGLNQNNIRSAPNAVGPENDLWLQKAAQESDLVVVAWGDFPWIKFRSRQVMNLLLPYTLHAVQVNANGTPSHPKAWRLKAAKVYRQSVQKVLPVAG
jgi:hypothetical protein